MFICFFLSSVHTIEPEFGTELNALRWMQYYFTFSPFRWANIKIERYLLITALVHVFVCEMRRIHAWHWRIFQLLNGEYRPSGTCTYTRSVPMRFTMWWLAGVFVCVRTLFFTRDADVRELQLHQSHSISGWVVCFYFRSVHLQNWHALEWFRFGCSENESMKFAWSTNFVDSNFISNHFYLMIIMCVCTRNT